MNLRPLVAALAALLGAGTATGAVSPRYSGTPIAQVFTERDVPGSPQTRSVCAHPNGFIYVGNTEGLVEYDGASWKMIPGTAGLIVHNVFADNSGRIWYSATGEFGCLVADEHGVLNAHPLHLRLPGSPDIGHVLRMLVHEQYAYFVTQGSHQSVVRADARGNLLVVPLPIGERPLSVFLHRDAVHVLTSQHVYRLDGPTPRAEPSANILASVEVRSVWPRDDGGAWVVSAAGLRRWDGYDALLVSSEVQQLLGDDRVSCGSPLGDGTFALGTEKHGLLIVEAATGRILARYDDDGGLGATSSTIVGVTLDAEGGLWLARFAGITRIQVSTPSALHVGPNGGVRGRVQALGFYRDRLHVATTQGVFVRETPTGRFALLPGALGDSWVLLPTDDGLIVGGPDLRLLRDDGTVEIIEHERLLFRSAVRLRRDPDRIVACTGPGAVRVYRRHEGKWQFEASLPHIRASLFPLLEDADGRLWATRNRIEVVRIDWRDGVNFDARLEQVGPALGLPFSAHNRSRAWIFLVDGSIEVTTWDGLWRHDRATDRLSPENRIEGLDVSRWSRAFPLSDGSLWFANTHEHDPAALARPITRDRWKLEPSIYSGLEAIRPLEVCDDPSTSTLWLGHFGLASIDRNARSAPPSTPVVRLRSIIASPTRLLWGGAGTPPLVPFPPEHRSLQFTYAAPSLRPNAHGVVKTEYRTRLDGFNRQWSAWTTSTHREYSNLPPGRFTLRLQARDTNGREGPEATFAFTLLPPWWRTWWAFTGYIALGLVGIGSLVRMRTRTLRRRNERLENLVTERTDTLFKQNQELARLHRLELDEKTLARLAAEKSRLETLRYQLNPHFLFNSLTSIRSQIPPGLVRARESIDRLADFCRRTLRDDGGDERTSLAEEFAMIRSYLDIERFRLGDLLAVTIELDPAAAPMLLPRLLLLPLVENALKYGAATSSDQLEIRISARREVEALTIDVANTGRWVEQPASHHVASLGIGHENLRERLNRYYPHAHEFTHQAADGWVRVVLRLRRSAVARNPSSR